MTRVHGFVLPIVVLMLTLMALVWSYTAMPTATKDQEREDYKHYQDTLVFWQKAIIAYSFQYGRVPLSASILAFTYDLQLPGAGADDSALNVSGYGLLQSEFELDIHGLPEPALTRLITEYSPHMKTGYFDNLIIPVLRPDDWDFSANLLPRLADFTDRLQTDLDLSNHNIKGVRRIRADVYAEELKMSSYVTVIQLRASSAVSGRLVADEAIVAEQDLVSVLQQFEQLEQQMNACFALGGGCNH